MKTLQKFASISTANPALESNQNDVMPIDMYPNEALTPLFEATVNATEEAIMNALVAADDMVGANGVKVFALPHEEVRKMMERWSQ